MPCYHSRRQRLGGSNRRGARAAPVQRYSSHHSHSAHHDDRPRTGVWLGTVGKRGWRSLATATAATVGRTASQVLIGWIPGVGNVVNACMAAAVTETVGWMLAKDFAQRTGVA